MWTDAALPKPSRDPGVLGADLDRFGYCVIERALDARQLESVQTRLFEQAAAERDLHSLKNPANLDPVNQWLGMLLNKGEIFFELVEHPLIAPLVEHLLGTRYLISCLDSQIQHPGAGVMPLHTDQWWMPPPVMPGEARVKASEITRGGAGALDPAPARGPVSPVVEANVMWMITDFTEENGATRVVPGSHASGGQPDPSVPHRVETVAAVGPPGTAIAFDGRLWHGAGANRTRASRYGITSVFCGPQCRTLENYTRGMRPEVLARCPPRLRERLGFATWSSYGHTGDPGARFAASGEEALGELRPAGDKAAN